MSQQSYLIDTNILIGLEDNHTVEAAYSRFHALALTHKVDIYVHEAAKDDIARDKQVDRRKISLSKIQKYRLLKKQRGLARSDLDAAFGPLKKPNDVVDATLLHALEKGAADFLVTQDKGLHQRAQNRSPDLARRVLFVSDATELLIQTYEPKEVPIRHVGEVEAHEINGEDQFFDSLRDGYPEFNEWWREKCVKQHRSCWVVYDNEKLAGLIVRKDENASNTDAVTKAAKVLKICTFKVAPESRGVKLGELLLKQVLWYAQRNRYDLAYLTTYEDQVPLMELLEYYGFRNAGKNKRGECIYERDFSAEALAPVENKTDFEQARENYPRFVLAENTLGFGIPIQEDYHDTLYPDLYRPLQGELFSGASQAETITRPGNTIRKVYLCRAQSKLGPPGSLLFFYKSTSKNPPSQAITALGILESVTLAKSTKDLMQLTGGRSVYSEEELEGWEATPKRPVKVINYLLVSYIDPAVSIKELKTMGVIKGHPQQSIYKLSYELMDGLVKRADLEFEV
ncbi:MAG: GNAT family N-acetyltransferase [Roseovarius pacificus]|nr:GNAT family N-acetyltransferase [Roseovarius pacificus]